MNKLMGFLAGAISGAVVGAIVTLLFTPAPGSEIIRSAEERWQLTIDEANRARMAKQRELEQQFENAKRM